MNSKNILFIVEKKLLEGQSYFGSSNDLLLICSALKANLEVYLTTPDKLEEQNFLAIKLSLPNWQKLNQIIKEIWKKEVFNSLKELPANPTDRDKQQSKILFENSNYEKINWQETIVFNRSEPISLNENFYKILTNLQNSSVKIFPNPALNQVLGDKLSVYALHYNQKIGDINLLQDVNFTGLENQISFESKIINISSNQLNHRQIEHFYQLLEKQNFDEAQKLFSKEWIIFEQGVKQYLQFHQHLNNDSIIKPASYFGGVGLIVAQERKLDFKLALKNIVNSFLAIKEDAEKNNCPNLAFLSQIIVQERAKHANLGDLRIVFCGKNLQGIFVRFNPNFEKFKVGNLHFGGYAKNFDLEKDLAANDLLDKLNFLSKIKTFQQYPIIGVDALLSQDKNGNYYYGINEINLTSPMGQVQLIILEIAKKVKDKPELLDDEIDKYLQHNFADQTIQFLLQ
jgi:hypothetical protein